MGGKSSDGRKVKGIIHWVSAKNAIDSEVRLYDRLFKVPNPTNSDNFMEHFNENSLTVLNDCKIDSSVIEIYKDLDYFKI